MVCAGYVTCVPVPDAGRGARKGDKVTGNLKVAQPARRRRGVTLIEAVLYISVALALIVGGLVFYQQAALASRMNTTVTLLSSLISEAQAVGAESRSLPFYENFTGYLVTRGSVPAAWLDKSKPLNEQIRNPWGGFVQVMAWFDTGPGGSPVFMVNLLVKDIPYEACTRLMAHTTDNRNIVSHGYDSGVGFDLYPFGIGAVLSSGKISYDSAMLACRQGDTILTGSNNDGRTGALLRYTFSGN